METKTKQLSLENSKCQTWEDESSFLKCCKEELTDILKKSIDCTIAGMEAFFPDNKTFLECQTNENAKVTYTKWVEILSEFYLDFWKNSCPLPCTHGSYNYEIQYFNQNSWNERSTPEMVNTTIGGLEICSLG